MSDQSKTWDKQWSELLTRCHGRAIEADAGFKAGLLDKLKRKAAEHIETSPVADLDDDAKWGTLMKAAYIPCHPEENFKKSLLAKIKAKQNETTSTQALGEPGEDEALRTILTTSYQPIQPRKEFETRLLDNLKERQRTAAQTRIHTRRRTLFLSGASSIAAAAAVMFVVWLGPVGGSVPQSEPVRSGDLRLTVPDTAVALAQPERKLSDSGVMFASFDSSVPVRAAESPASHFETVPAMFSSYKAADAFAGNPLPEMAVALQNVEMNGGKGWLALANAQPVNLQPGSVFRASNGMGHLKFSDGSLVSISPDTLLQATAEGLMVTQGFMLVAVPSSTDKRFRLHFPERDIAVEPGTDLAVMVENPDKFAAGGAPAPMVMVVDGEGETGGLALARGKNGIGPLFAKQLYRLDNYVTPDLPGRTLCDTECNDLNKLFKMETVRQDGIPMAAFASGGFAGERELSNYAMVLTPAGFTKKGTRWVADDYNGEPTIKLKYLSDAYFGFANERRDLARELALGGEVVLDGGDGTFYEVVR